MGFLEELDVYVHIGYHKTASTLLQNQLFSVQQDAYYIFLGDRKGGDWLSQLESTNCDFDGFISYVKGIINIQKKQIGAKNKLIISHERLSGHIEGAKVVNPYNAIHNIKSLFPAAKVLVIIRNQLDYLSSLYAFRVAIKGEQYWSPKKYYGIKGNDGLYEKMLYSKLILFCMEMFGENNVLVLPYELLKINPQRFIDQICGFLNIKFIEIHQVTKRVNASTNSMFVLNFWRPINFIFYVFLIILNCILSLIGMLKLGGFHSFKKRQVVAHCIAKKFYALKKRITPALCRCNFRQKFTSYDYIDANKLELIRVDNSELNKKLNGILNSEFGYIFIEE